MATSKIFKKVPTIVPNRSGFNMSHNNFFSAPVGTLVPSLIDFLIPGDEIDLSSKLHVQLPPMATDFYGRIEAKEEAFFVPARILFGGWKDFYVNPTDNTTNPSNIDGQLAKYLIGATLGTPESAAKYLYFEASGSNLSDAYVNSINMFADYVRENISKDNYKAFVNFNSDYQNYLGAGSLADYLGFKVSDTPIAVKDFSNLSYAFNTLSPDLFYIATSRDNDLNRDRVVARLTSDGIYEYTSAASSAIQFEVDPDNFDFNLYNYFIRVERLSSTSVRLTVRFTEFYLKSNTPTFDNTPINVPIINSTLIVRVNNILPLLAYHKVYDDWYRAPMIQQSLFKRNVANSSASTSVANMPWITSGAQNKIYFNGEQLLFANGHHLFDLHQRNWQKDYFTSATPEPQAGEAASVKFDIENDSGEFTIASLRAANALQQWLEKNNIGGFRYGDLIYAQYGVYPSDAITDRAIYLGSSSTEVYNKSIYQQSGDGGTNTNNPFNAIGSKYSNPTGLGNGNYCNNYKVTEAGFVIKIFSLVPQAYYSTGVRRFFMHNDISDIAFPVLAGVGDQPIYGRELTDVYSGTGDDTVFGYVQRYADYKFIDDQVHGLLRDGQSLDSFALQRSFTSVPELGSDFLQIPKDYLDQVSATDYKLSKYGCWVNCYNDYRKSSTLPAYSIPTLEDMKGHTVLVDKGGNYIA